MSETKQKSLLPIIGLLGTIMLITLIIQAFRTVRRPEETRSIRPFAEYRPDMLGKEKPEAGKAAEPGSLPEMTGMLQLAMLKWRSGDFTGAENDLKTILVFQPDNLTALSYLGTLCHDRGDFRTAEFYFRKQTAAYPTYYAGYLNLSTVLLKQNRIEEALRESNRAFQLNPASYKTALSLAKLHAYNGDTDLAVSYFDRAASADPGRTLEELQDPMLDPLRSEERFQAAETSLRQKVQAQRHE